MKKFILGLAVTLALFFTAVVPTYAAATTDATPTTDVVEPTPTPEVAKVVYTWIKDEANTLVLTLNGDGTGSAVATYEGKPAEGAITYSIKNDVLKVLTIDGEAVGAEEFKFTINVDNTLTPIISTEPINPTPNEGLEVPEEVAGIIEWLKGFNKSDLEALFGVTIGFTGVSIFTLLGLLIKGIIDLIQKNRREEKESQIQKAAIDKITDICRAGLETINSANEEQSKRLINYINTLDNTKRKEAIEASAAIQNTLDDIIKGVEIDQE